MVYEVCFSLLPARKVLVISVSLLYHFRAEIQGKIAVAPNCHALDQFSVIGYIIPQAATNKFWTFQQGF